MMNIQPASPQRLGKDLSHLVNDIGIRLAGSPQEKATVDFLTARFSEAGATTHTEQFPLMARDVKSEQLQLHIGGEWKTFPCSLLSNVPGTDGKTLEAPLVLFEAAVDYQRQDLSFLRGKAVLHLDTHIESRADYKRLMDANPAFLLFVDVRHPGVTPLGDGMFPEYTRSIGAKPVVNVAFMDAWQWKAQHANAARLTVTGGMTPANGYNVIAELPGDPNYNDILFAGSHHDTQAGTPGADDNGAGTVILLELARLLANRPRKRTIRLIAFGAEEQLSVGSSSYVRAHRAEIEQRGRFMLNFDSCGADLGWTCVSGVGGVSGNKPDAMFSLLRNAFTAQNKCIKTQVTVDPYTDQFPFSVCGLPGVWVSRACCTVGRFWHHRWDDDMRNVSPDEMATIADAGASVLDSLANADTIPFSNGFSPEITQRINNIWNNLYGGWNR